MSGLSHIVLELAREPDRPFGDKGHGYHLYMPLTPEGRIDADAWQRNRQFCHAHRFRPGESEAIGQIRHGPGGRWIFDYDRSSSRDDEVGFRLNAERFVPGEYVSIREDDGKMHTFRVVSVQPV